MWGEGMHPLLFPKSLRLVFFFLLADKRAAVGAIVVANQTSRCYIITYQTAVGNEISLIPR
jgi:hypothetical protein